MGGCLTKALGAGSRAGRASGRSREGRSGARAELGHWAGQGRGWHALRRLASRADRQWLGEGNKGRGGESSPQVVRTEGRHREPVGSIGRQGGCTSNEMRKKL